MDWWRLYEVLAAYFFGCYITRADSAYRRHPWVNWAVSVTLAALWPVSETINAGMSLSRWHQRQSVRRNSRG